jgi:hypothetical protein
MRPVHRQGREVPPLELAAKAPLEAADTQTALWTPRLEPHVIANHAVLPALGVTAAAPMRARRRRQAAIDARMLIRQLGGSPAAQDSGLSRLETADPAYTTSGW